MKPKGELNLLKRGDMWAIRADFAAEDTAYWDMPGIFEYGVVGNTSFIAQDPTEIEFITKQYWTGVDYIGRRHFELYTINEDKDAILGG